MKIEYIYIPYPPSINLMQLQPLELINTKLHEYMVIFSLQIRYLIGGSVLYYPQLSSISSYQLYVEVSKIFGLIYYIQIYNNTKLNLQKTPMFCRLYVKNWIGFHFIQVTSTLKKGHMGIKVNKVLQMRKLSLLF